MAIKPVHGDVGPSVETPHLDMEAVHYESGHHLQSESTMRSDHSGDGNFAVQDTQHAMASEENSVVVKSQKNANFS